MHFRVPEGARKRAKCGRDQSWQTSKNLLWESEKGDDGDEKYCLSGNKVASEKLPEAKSTVSCTMEGVEPGTRQVAKVFHHLVAMLLSKSQNRSLCARI